jgi:hypothetical protein
MTILRITNTLDQPKWALHGFCVLNIVVSLRFSTSFDNSGFKHG